MLGEELGRGERRALSGLRRPCLLQPRLQEAVRRARSATLQTFVVTLPPNSLSLAGPLAKIVEESNCLTDPSQILKEHPNKRDCPVRRRRMASANLLSTLVRLIQSNLCCLVNHSSVLLSA